MSGLHHQVTSPSSLQERSKSRAELVKYCQWLQCSLCQIEMSSHVLATFGTLYQDSKCRVSAAHFYSIVILNARHKAKMTVYMVKNFSVGVIYEDGEIPRLLSSSLLKICSLVCPSHTNFAKIFSKNKYSQSLPFDGTLIELDNLLPMIFLFPSIVVFLSGQQWAPVQIWGQCDPLTLSCWWSKLGLTWW